MMIGLLSQELNIKEPCSTLLMDQLFIVGHTETHHPDHTKGGDGQGQECREKGRSRQPLEHPPEESKKDISQDPFHGKNECVQSDDRNPSVPKKGEDDIHDKGGHEKKSGAQ